MLFTNWQSIKKAVGITFTDKDRNIITEIDDDEDDQGMEKNEPIPVADNSPPDEDENTAIGQQ